jgi:RNA-dependent RNA polymerase
VHFNLRIKTPAKADRILPPFSYEVVRAEKSTSNRARRQYGSAAFVQASAESKFVNGALLDFLQRPLIILGRVYRAFCEKEGHVYFVRTNEVFRGGVIQGPPPGANKGWPTFLQFVMDFNPMDENQCQVACVHPLFHRPTCLSFCQPLVKWAARFVLFLSPSVPVPCPVDETNDLHLDDVGEKAIACTY